MADYYREARQAKRALKDTAGTRLRKLCGSMRACTTLQLAVYNIDNNKRAREKRRELGIERGEDLVEHPLNFLTVEGRGVKLYKNAEQHAAVERNEGLIPWNDDPENLIDRFDARSLLDFYRDPIATSVVRPKTSQEEKLHEVTQPSCQQPARHAYGACLTQSSHHHQQAPLSCFHISSPAASAAPTASATPTATEASAALAALAALATSVAK
ncbi:hypothetical protein QJQ45_000348 [Haematococcus lacustris]|nr:hypothetical protein QJQ45_000348 [Haematococcus lacustris]